MLQRIPLGPDMVSSCQTRTSKFIETFKINILRFLVLTLFTFISAACGQTDSVSSSKRIPVSAPKDMKVGEGFVNPLGYYEASPRFSWVLPETSNAQFQSAYRIQVATSLKQLSDNADLWDSHKVLSHRTSWVTYAGKELVSRQKLFWRVKVWDENDQPSAWSTAQSIELGLLNTVDWQGKWIGHPNTVLSENPSQATLATPQYLRNSFEVKGKVKKARLYITSKGLFKPYLNGVEIAGQDVMTPGWTPYAKRIESLTYDVTDKMIQGENVIAASLAGGWYAGRVSDFIDRDHKLPARLLAQLEITYATISCFTSTGNCVIYHRYWRVTITAYGQITMPFNICQICFYTFIILDNLNFPAIVVLTFSASVTQICNMTSHLVNFHSSV